MLKIVKEIVAALEISPQGSHVAVVSYSSRAYVDLKFNTFTGSDLNHNEINNAIDSVTHQRGYTYIDKALNLANTEVFTTAGGMRNDVRKVKTK